jgi:hypothetical protein
MSTLTQTSAATKARLDKVIKARILERVQDGCWTAESVLACPECGNRMFDLDQAEVVRFMQALVDDGLAEWRERKVHGTVVQLCVPLI